MPTVIEYMEDFHLSNKINGEVLWHKHSKLAWKFNFHTFGPWFLAAPKANLWFFVIKSSPRKCPGTLKYPWAGNNISSKLYFKYLLHTNIVISGRNSQEPMAFWQKKVTTFLNSLVLTKCVKFGRFWDGHSTKMPNSYKKQLLKQTLWNK